MRLGFMRFGRFGLVPVDTSGPIVAQPVVDGAMTILPYEPPPSKLPFAPPPETLPKPLPAPSTPTILVAPPVALPEPTPAPVAVVQSVTQTPAMSIVPLASKSRTAPALVGAAGGFVVAGPIGAAVGGAAGLIYGMLRR